MPGPHRRSAARWRVSGRRRGRTVDCLVASFYPIPDGAARNADAKGYPRNSGQWSAGGLPRLVCLGYHVNVRSDRYKYKALTVWQVVVIERQLGCKQPLPDQLLEPLIVQPVFKVEVEVAVVAAAERDVAPDRP